VGTLLPPGLPVQVVGHLCVQAVVSGMSGQAAQTSDESALEVYIHDDALYRLMAFTFYIEAARRVSGSVAKVFSLRHCQCVGTDVSLQLNIVFDHAAATVVCLTIHLCVTRQSPLLSPYICVSHDKVHFCHRTNYSFHSRVC